jgi:hypothetical protein
MVSIIIAGRIFNIKFIIHVLYIIKSF